MISSQWICLYLGKYMYLYIYNYIKHISFMHLFIYLFIELYYEQWSLSSLFAHHSAVYVPCTRMGKLFQTYVYNLSIYCAHTHNIYIYNIYICKQWQHVHSRSQPIISGLRMSTPRCTWRWHPRYPTWSPGRKPWLRFKMCVHVSSLITSIDGFRSYTTNMSSLIMFNHTLKNL